MSSRSPSPMEQGEIEASPDLHGSPGIILDPDDDYTSRQTVRSSDKEKPGKTKRDSGSPERHEDVDDVLNIQPPQIAHVKKDKHRHHRHGKGDSHKRATREAADKYPAAADNRHVRDDRPIRKYDDKTRGKHSKRETEMTSTSREFAKQQMQQDREVEALRRQKSQQERERLERLERERYRIEKERQMKEREYWAKMKKSEQEQAARNDQERRSNDQERRQQRTERFWRDDERDRQNSDELAKRRAKDVNKKGGRQQSRTRSRSPLLRPSKEISSEKDLRRIPSDQRRDEPRDVRRHEPWIKDKRGSDQDRGRDRDHDRDQEQYLRSKLYSGMNKDEPGRSQDEHPQRREEEDDLSAASDRSDSDDDDEPEDAGQEARQSSVSPDESEKSHESNASRRSRSERSLSERSTREEEEAEEEQAHAKEENHRHSAHEDVLRSKFDDDEEEEERRSESDDRGSRDSASSGVDDDDKDGIYMEDSPIPSSPELQLPPYFPALQGCRNVEEFQCLNRIEEGTYGVVYRAVDLKKEEVVALKRLKMEKEKEGFPITSLREINTLLKAQHPNIVTVREIVVGSNMDKIYIVMDYVEHDLKSLMEYMKEPFSIGEVKTLLQQLLRGVAHLHDNWIIHRDLKTSNLLLSHKGILKVGDFGLAREYGSPLRAYTPIVVTLWYRAPELLLGAKEYSIPIDLWSVGCIMAEFLTRKPLFPGKSDIDQLNRIFKDLGTPNEKIWPGVGELPAMKKCTFTEYPFNQLQSKFKLLLTAKGLDMLNRFLTYNPEKRVSAEDAKRHEFFTESPLPVDPAMFPTWPAKSEQSKTRTHGNSPKPPSGGKAYAKLLGDDDEYGARFHLGGPTTGEPAKSSFALKF